MTNTETTDLDVYTPPGPALDPGTPEGVSWFDATLRQAEYLAGSAIVPDQYRGKPADIVVAAMYGRDMGWSPTMAMTHIHVVKGKPSLSAQSMVALVRGAGHSITGTKSETEAVAVGTRGDNGDTMTETFTMDNARAAGLAGSQTWKSYPSAMLWARAVSALCRSLFPDVLMGLSYTPEELEGIPDAATPEPVDTRSEDDMERDRLLSALGELVRKLGPELAPDWAAWKKRNTDWQRHVPKIREAIDHVAGVLAKAGHEPFDEIADNPPSPGLSGTGTAASPAAVPEPLHNNVENDKGQPAKAAGVVRETTELPSVESLVMDAGTVPNAVPVSTPNMFAEHSDEPF
jgi:hypothetical protein